MNVVHPYGAIMPAFLIIASLSLAFYLVLLVFLYRDGRKRRSGGGSVYKVQPGSVAELGPLPTMVYAGSSPRRRNAARVLVRFAANSSHDRLKSKIVQGKAAEIITVPTLARDNKDTQCG
jgi:hypothetical protein